MFLHSYLLEKDINGDVTEELDLKCLLDVNANCDVIAEVGDDVSYCLKMTFDYVNKNKRERHIIMEDEESSKVCGGNFSILVSYMSEPVYVDIEKKIDSGNVDIALQRFTG